ncbi:hypothetical protein A5722_16980 [Mycobacterium vulneris]|nr:hypothetical protein A5722_16980 [Mycolicibacterium vulneris]OCB65576.1 hypothetical protein A5729_15815 [Mycolicibacterium vulneris]
MGDSAGTFGPSVVVRIAVVCATFAPALLMIAMRGLWPQTWVRIALVVVGIVAVAVTTAFFRLAVARRQRRWMVLRGVRPRGDVSTLLGVFVFPSLVALTTPVDAQWAAVVALILLGVIAERTDAILTDNPILALFGLYAFDADIHDGSTGIILSRNRSTYAGEALSLVCVARGIYVETEMRQSAPDLAESIGDSPEGG